MNVPDNLTDETIEAIEELHKLKKDQHGADSLHAKRVFLILAALRRLRELDYTTCKNCDRHRDDLKHNDDYEPAGGGEFERIPAECQFTPRRIK